MAIPPDYDSPIWQASLPHEAIIPLLQHRGEEAKALVRPGDQVREGQLIGRVAKGGGIHASIPGVVQDIIPLRLPSAKTCRAIKIKLSGRFDYIGKNISPFNWRNSSPEQLIANVAKKGLVQLDGLADDLAELFENCRRWKTETVVINAASGAPFLSSEIRILQEEPEKIVEAVQIIQHILKVKHLLFVCAKRWQARDFLRIALERGVRIKVKSVQETYPEGNAHELERRFSRKGEQSSRLQVAVFNISTLLALYGSVVLRRALIDQVLTVGGEAIGVSKTIKARIGTPLWAIFQEVGGLRVKPAKIIVGLPLQGHEVKDSTTPISKQITSIFALSEDECGGAEPTPCIQCGSCVDYCPASLEPVLLHKLLQGNRPDEAVEQGLLSCWLCGICSHVCPSQIPLTTIMKNGIIAASEGDGRGR